MILVRPVRLEDWPAIRAIVEPTIRAGETYALDADMSEDEVRSYWLGPDKETFVAEEDGSILGTGLRRRRGRSEDVCRDFLERLARCELAQDRHVTH